MTLSCLCGRRPTQYRVGDHVVIRPEARLYLEFPFSHYAKTGRRGQVSVVVDEMVVHVVFPSNWPFVNPKSRALRVNEIFHVR
jgi:hypothetical protein